jgi:hypothetical protein
MFVVRALNQLLQNIFEKENLYTIGTLIQLIDMIQEIKVKNAKVQQADFISIFALHPISCFAVASGSPHRIMPNTNNLSPVARRQPPLSGHSYGT